MVRVSVASSRSRVWLWGWASVGRVSDLAEAFVAQKAERYPADGVAIVIRVPHG